MELGFDSAQNSIQNLVLLVTVDCFSNVNGNGKCNEYTGMSVQHMDLKFSICYALFTDLVFL